MTRSERYEIIEKVQHGAVAETFKARDRVLDRLVLLKVLHPRLAADSDLVQRFRREALLQARLKHPNIVTVYDFGSEQDFYIASEFIEGGTLADLLRRQGRLTVDELRPVVLAVVAALRYAHSQGVVHRDLKPANILIPDKGDVRLADFGLAFCREMDQLTQEGCVIGTPAYMSPAQARGQPTDRRADMFSLGVVIYEALSGTNPFQAPSHAEALSRVLNLDPPPLQQVAPGTDPAISSLVARMLVKDRDAREDSLDAVAAAFCGTAAAPERSRLNPFLLPIATAAVLSALGIFAGIKLLNRRDALLVPAAPDSGLVAVSHVLAESVVAPRPASASARPGPPAAPSTSRTLEPSPPETPEPSRSVVHISVLPWAEVSVDGRSLGITPLAEPVALTPGPHRLRLRNPYYPELEKTITVSGRTYELAVDLGREFALLDITVAPWGVVAIDGEVVDTTPLRQPIPVLPGTHSIRVEHPDLGIRLQTIRADSPSTYRLSVSFVSN